MSLMEDVLLLHGWHDNAKYRRDHQNQKNIEKCGPFTVTTTRSQIRKIQNRGRRNQTKKSEESERFRFPR